jgi:uncharacterized coiled-coil protein SlyX
MSMPRVSALASLALLIVAAASPAAFAQPAERPPYVALRLPDDWYVSAINDARHMVGTDAQGNAFMWHVDDNAVVALPAGQPIDINNNDQVLFNGFVWDAGVVTPLRPLPGAADGYVTAQAMNDRGQIVGWGYDAEWWAQPLLWASANSVPQALPLLGGAQTGSATALNEAGQIIGSSSTYTYNSDWGSYYYDTRSVLWQNGVVTELGGQYSSVTSLNAAGVVVGNDSSWTPVKWVNGVPQRLADSLHGFTGLSWAAGINDRGDIFGSTAEQNPWTLCWFETAMVWADDNPVSLGHTNVDACASSFISAFNNHSDVVGDGNYSLSNWSEHYLWTRTPPAAPNADAGPDFTFNAAYAPRLILDASRTTDPRNRDLTYEWLLNGTPIATGIRAEVDLQPGVWTITLHVKTAQFSLNGEATDSVTVTVEDPVPTLLGQVAGLQATVSGQEQTIAELRDTIAQREATIALQQAALAGLPALQAQLAGVSTELDAANATVAAVRAQVDRLQDVMRTALRNPSFVLPGATLAEKIRYLVDAVDALSPGLKKTLY